MDKVPLLGPLTGVTPVSTVWLSPSGSKSLSNTFPETAVPVLYCRRHHSQSNIPCIRNYCNDHYCSITKAGVPSSQMVYWKVSIPTYPEGGIGISTCIGVDVHRNALSSGNASGSYHYGIIVRIVIVYQKHFQFTGTSTNVVLASSLATGGSFWGPLLGQYFDINRGSIGGLWVSVILNGILERVISLIISWRGYSMLPVLASMVTVTPWAETTEVVVTVWVSPSASVSLVEHISANGKHLHKCYWYRP